MSAVLNNYVTIDIETTGLSPARHEIVELAAVRFRDFAPADSFSSLVKPLRGIQAHARAVNGVTREMTKDAPLIAAAAEKFLNFIGDEEIIVGHNIQFDLSFLTQNGVRLARIDRRIYDTMRIAKNRVPRDRCGGYSLSALCEYYGIDRENAHRAKADCIATGTLFAKLARK